MNRPKLTTGEADAAKMVVRALMEDLLENGRPQEAGHVRIAVRLLEPFVDECPRVSAEKEPGPVLPDETITTAELNLYLQHVQRTRSLAAETHVRNLIKELMLWREAQRAPSQASAVSPGAEGRPDASEPLRVELVADSPSGGAGS